MTSPVKEPVFASSSRPTLIHRDPVVCAFPARVGGWPRRRKAIFCLWWGTRRFSSCHFDHQAQHPVSRLISLRRGVSGGELVRPGRGAGSTPASRAALLMKAGLLRVFAMAPLPTGPSVVPPSGMIAQQHMAHGPCFAPAWLERHHSEKKGFAPCASPLPGGSTCLAPAFEAHVGNFAGWTPHNGCSPAPATGLVDFNEPSDRRSHGPNGASIVIFGSRTSACDHGSAEHRALSPMRACPCLVVVRELPIGGGSPDCRGGPLRLQAIRAPRLCRRARGPFP